MGRQAKVSDTRVKASGTSPCKPQCLRRQPPHCMPADPAGLCTPVVGGQPHAHAWLQQHEGPLLQVLQQQNVARRGGAKGLCCFERSWGPASRKNEQAATRACWTGICQHARLCSPIAQNHCSPATMVHNQDRHKVSQGSIYVFLAPMMNQRIEATSTCKRGGKLC